MPRRKQDDFPTLLFQALRNLPWWVGPLFIVATFVILRLVFPAVIDVPQLHADLSTPETSVGFSGQVMRKSAADFSRMAAPWATLVVAGIWVIALAAKRKRR